MEAEVDKLELMCCLLQAEPWVTSTSALVVILEETEYHTRPHSHLQKMLEYEIKTNHPVTAGKKNPVTLLKELSAIKSRYQTLHARFKPIAAEQQETKNRICATVNKTMTMIQELQKQTDLELSPLSKEEQTAAEQLKSFMSDL
ncbi:LOW QUALITY PROTEIN: spindle and kinetochore-associated protein 2 [Lutra lutra]|uniref:LOW QUALITY PROTEIN: spindle and kinetochore-associated protein 2 n=1 Tax=Lutra lutra TaxID=9657 RepID=UPI001FD14B40|nr:LOW QUALITY PROTEIN: spindle and kinetochore-associated protein 2 [Lutra lutra]